MHMHMHMHLHMHLHMHIHVHMHMHMRMYLVHAHVPGPQVHEWYLVTCVAPVRSQCANLKWQVCAAQGKLPGQRGQRIIKFARAPGNMPIADGPHPFGKCSGFKPKGCDYGYGCACRQLLQCVCHAPTHCAH
jgi:hypothetical protein